MARQTGSAKFVPSANVAHILEAQELIARKAERVRMLQK
jgi:hypothetical protein